MLVAPAMAFGSAVVHGLLILPLILGASATRTRQPNAQGAGASAIVSSAEPAMTMVMINIPDSARDHDSTPDLLASRGPAPPDLKIRILSADPTPVFNLKSLTTDQDAPDPIPEAAGDTAGHALMFGRYMGQIQARVERAWLRPRSALAGPLFQCRVRIVQNKRGEVLEVTMAACNGDARWQASLAQAIQAASPLPAPPDPAVYADALELSFGAEAYQAGGDGEGYEPEVIRVALKELGIFQRDAMLSETLDAIESASPNAPPAATAEPNAEVPENAGLDDVLMR